MRSQEDAQGSVGKRGENPHSITGETWFQLNREGCDEKGIRSTILRKGITRCYLGSRRSWSCGGLMLTVERSRVFVDLHQDLLEVNPCLLGSLAAFGVKGNYSSLEISNRRE